MQLIKMQNLTAQINLRMAWCCNGVKAGSEFQRLILATRLLILVEGAGFGRRNLSLCPLDRAALSNVPVGLAG